MQLEEAYVETILRWSNKRIYYLSDLVAKELAFIWVVPKNYSNVEENDLTVITSLIHGLGQEEEFDKEKLNLFLKNFAKGNNVKYSAFMKKLRTILSGLKVRNKKAVYRIS